MTREEQVAMVKEMREMTGAGMMNCKKALEQTKWNMEEAIKYFKKMTYANKLSHVDYFNIASK